MKFSVNNPDFYIEECIKIESLLPYQLDIWSDILGFRIEPYEKFANPFRSDRHPGCWLAPYDKFLILVDFANKEFHGVTVFEMIKRINNVDFKQALIIASKAIPSFAKPTYFSSPKRSSFKIVWKYRNWRKEDKEVWNYGGINRASLEYERCLPIDTYWTNSRDNVMKSFHVKDSLAYGYMVNDHRKIYKPNGIPKFISNMTQDDIGGRLPFRDNKHLVISKSIKDYLILESMGFDCRFLPSESIYLSESTIPLFSKFKRVSIFMDNDDAGKKALERYRKQTETLNIQTDFNFVHLPEESIEVTDPFDSVKHFGYDRSKKTINEILKNAA